MDSERREFLEALLTTPSPSGYETPVQRVWVEYVEQFADEVSTDAYGNAVAVHNGSGGGPELAFAGHADEIGFAVRDITDDGFLRLARIGGSDRTVSKGQHVTVHSDEPVHGVIGQTAIHLRDTSEDEYEEIAEQFVDIGAEDGAEARTLVEVGDPVTFTSTVFDMHGERLTARGMDNRIGIWTAAEALRSAVESDVEATVYGVATIQEELGLNGARMVGYDLDPDAAVAVDVTHATDTPDVDTKSQGPVTLGDGPVVGRGSANHPILVDLARTSAEEREIAVQLQAAGSRTGTDADAFFTSRGGTPALNIGLPNRYMHTPVEVIDTGDLTAVAELLGAMAERAPTFEPFTIDI